MQEDFHYYATYCAAYLAGYSHRESLDICYSAQLVDECTVTFLEKIKAPKAAATTQSQMELMNVVTDIIGLQNVTRIWSSFHFLPYDLYAKLPRRPRRYLNKYRLVCGPNGSLVRDTVVLGKGKGTQAAGIAMHVLADTWAHSYFAGTPSNVINNTNAFFYEILEENGVRIERKVKFNHNPATADDVEKGIYTNSIHQEKENSIMNLGHGRAGHFPDYSFARYKYLPAYGEYEIVEKDNQEDYYKAFMQMVQALRYLRGEEEDFSVSSYAEDIVLPYKEEIKNIISKRQVNACSDWKAFGEKLSGEPIEKFDINKYQKEYTEASKEEKDKTFLGKFVTASMAQKSMVTNKIFKSGNMLAGFSIEYDSKHFKGIKDFKRLIEYQRKDKEND
ncbi:MAG: hypothetical protein Q4D29_01770 [Lachnospiraceae bacterium]|nr:hypothetical protein [Lachnospiraceae bacterium]